MLRIHEGNPVRPFLDPFQRSTDAASDGCNKKYNNYYYYIHYPCVDKINRKLYIQYTHADAVVLAIYIFQFFFFLAPHPDGIPNRLLCAWNNITWWLIHAVHGTLYIIMFPPTVVPLAHDSACAKQSVSYCHQPFPNSRAISWTFSDCQARDFLRRVLRANHQSPPHTHTHTHYTCPRTKVSVVVLSGLMS